MQHSRIRAQAAPSLAGLFHSRVAIGLILLSLSISVQLIMQFARAG